MTIRLTFTQDFIWVPPEDRRVAIKYLAGKTYQGIRRACADDAKAAAVAVSPSVARKAARAHRD